MFCIVTDQSEEYEPQNANNRQVAGRNARLQRNQRNRLRVNNRNQNNDLVDEDDDDIGENNNNNRNRVRNFDDDEEMDEARAAAEREELRKKIGTKKLAKLEEKAAKREEREVNLFRIMFKIFQTKNLLIIIYEKRLC